MDGYTVDAQKKSVTVAAGDNKIVFKYTRRNDLTYTANYLEKGTNKALQEADTVTDLTYGEEVMVQAAVIAGYTVDSDSKQITIDVDDNVVNFYYTRDESQTKDLSYTVEYYKDNVKTDTVKDTQTVQVLQPDTLPVTHTAPSNKYDGYKLEKIKVNDGEAQDTMPITVTNGDVIRVYYVKTTATYRVEYYKQFLGGDGYELVDDYEKEEAIGSLVKAEIKTYTGFNLNQYKTIETMANLKDGLVFRLYYDRKNLGYTVNCLDVENGESIHQEHSEGEFEFVVKAILWIEKISIPGYEYIGSYDEDITLDDLDANENVMNLSYKKRSDLRYTVNYVDEEGNVIADAKTVQNNTFGDIVTENALDIVGYVKPEPDSQTLKIGADETENVITFTYTKGKYNYRVEYYYNSTTPNTTISDKELYGTQVENISRPSTMIYKGAILALARVDGLPLTITTDEEANVIKLYYLPDEISDPNKDSNKNPDDGDGIPDKYQAKVIYKVVNGTWQGGGDAPKEFIYTWAEEENGNWKAGNIGNIKWDKDTPIPEPKSGYSDPKEGWSPELRGTNVLKGGETVEFVYRFVPDEASIVFNTNGGSEVDTMTGETDAAIADTTMPETTRTGFTFDGWYANADLTGEEVKALPTAFPAGMTTYYAKWTNRTDLSYTVNYLEQGTDKVLSEAKTVEGQTFQAEVTENAIDITGYDKADPTEATITIGVENNVINFYYTKRTDLSYTVKYVDETGKEVASAKTVTGQTFGEKVTEAAIAVENYTVVGDASKALTISADETENVITFQYAKDEIGTDPKNPDKPDGIADKYQVTVTYEATNGTVSLGTAVVTLLDENGKPAENGTGYLAQDQIPAAAANEGYNEASKTWTPEAPETTTAITEARTFKVTWDKGSYGYTVNYHYDGIVETSSAEGIFGTEIPYATTSPKEYNGSNYMLERVEGEGRTIGVDSAQNVVDVYYTLDSIGAGEDPNQPDGIPDKYQVTVTYVAEHGTVAFGTAVVTLLDENGRPAENGTGYLKEGQIPAATPDKGYNGRTEKWSPEEPTTSLAITESREFKVTWSRVTPAATTDPTPDPTPTPDPDPTPDPTPTPDPDPTPAPAPEPVPPTPTPEETTAPAPVPGGVVPGAPAGAGADDGAAAVVAVSDEEVPLANIDLGDGDGEEPVGVEELVGVEDEEVPLLFEDLHDCCILHFLEMLIATFLLVWYTHNSKKRQNRVFELREQLAVEQTNRGAGIQNRR
ncbi:MAG: InlB B-repeat-containing protein [Butyrivibrio sp.]|nr:InlB B-repeat-containing protein [Butyrivibrio sp.]